jgi:hypothetical protein
LLKDQDSKKAEISILAKVGELEIAVPGIDTDGCNGKSNLQFSFIKITLSQANHNITSL